jgi:hypothetical protein
MTIKKFVVPADELDSRIGDFEFDGFKILDIEENSDGTYTITVGIP